MDDDAWRTECSGRHATGARAGPELNNARSLTQVCSAFELNNEGASSRPQFCAQPCVGEERRQLVVCGEPELSAGDVQLHIFFFRDARGVPARRKCATG